MIWLYYWVCFSRASVLNDWTKCDHNITPGSSVWSGNISLCHSLGSKGSKTQIIGGYRWYIPYVFRIRWRHNGRDGVSNHQPHDCLFNRLFRRRSKKTSKLHVTGLCVGNSLETGDFPAQMASNAKNVSIWWRHHGIMKWENSDYSHKGYTSSRKPGYSLPKCSYDNFENDNLSFWHTL